jgi:GNAT superfamily N-acetyltransferase
MPDMSGPDTTHPADETTGVDPSGRLSVGIRVVVRQRLVGDDAGGATDVIGDLVERTDDELVIETRRGRVAVPRRDVLAAKPVPPRPTRPGPAHLRVSVDDLAVLAARGWVAVDQEPLGSWLLRSADGYTGRANSVLTIGDPGMPIDEAISRSEQWYSDRGQPPMFQVTGPTGFAIGEHPVGAALMARGYEVGGGRADWARVLVMTGPAHGLPPLAPGAPRVMVQDELTPEWLEAHSGGRPVVPGATETVLTGSERQLFLSIRDGDAAGSHDSGRIVAIARLAMHPGWLGIFGMWVHPDHRRRGLARTLLSAVGRFAREHAIRAIYLQVSADNDPGIVLYEGLGFTVHHEYTYLTPPR